MKRHISVPLLLAVALLVLLGVNSVAQEFRGFERVLAALKLARAADEGERQAVADLKRGAFHARNADDGGGVHGCPLWEAHR